MYGFGKETIKLRKSTWEWIQREYNDTMKEYGKIPKYHEWLSHFPDISRPHNLGALSNETMCYFMIGHNQFARAIMGRLMRDRNTIHLSDPLIDVTPEMAREVGYYTDESGNEHMELFTVVTVPVSRWTGEYYASEMNNIFDKLPGKDKDEPFSPPLAPDQAYDVIRLFEPYLDSHQENLELIKEYNELFPSDSCVYCYQAGEWHLDSNSDLPCWNCKVEECKNYEPIDEEEALCVYCDEVYEKKYMVKLDESFDPPGEERYACQECFGIESQDGTPDLDGDGNEIIEDEEEEDEE